MDHARRNVLQYGGGSRRVLGLMFEAILARGSMAPILPIHCGTGKIRLAARISEKLRALSETAAGLGNWPAALAEAAMPRHMFADTPATHSRPHDGSTPPNAPATTVEVRRDEVGATRFSLQRGRDERCCPLLKSPKSDLSLEPGRMSDRRICYRADLFTAVAAGKSTRCSISVGACPGSR